jgi:hypothetical protein
VAKQPTDRPKVECPVCHLSHTVTLEGRLWIHGKWDARCRGSSMRVTQEMYETTAQVEQ